MEENLLDWCIKYGKVHLITEWNRLKNKDLTPENIMPRSQKKVNWICPKGHEYIATVAHRTLSESGCPYCANKKILIGFNDLVTTHPDLAREWNSEKNEGLKAEDFTAGSGKIVWWICERGHEWKTQISNRKRGTGCPVCKMEHQTSFPEQAIFFYLKMIYDVENRYKIYGQEIDIYIPELNLAIEYDGAYYHKGNRLLKDLEKEKLLIAKGVRIIRIKEDTDEQTNGNIIHFKYTNSYKFLNEAIRKLLEMIGADYNFEIDIEKDRTKIQGQYILSLKKNSIAVRFPDVATEWDYCSNEPLTPEMIPYSSNRRYSWICSVCKEKWMATAGHRARGAGCPKCGKIKQNKLYRKNMLENRGSLVTRYPEIAKEWHPTLNKIFTPQKITIGSDVLATWICSKCNHIWEARVYQRTKGIGCPECGKIKSAESYIRTMIINKGSLLEKHPQIAKNWHPTLNGGLKATDITAGSNRKVWWIGECGHEWQCQVKYRVNGVGCPICAAMKRGENRRIGVLKKKGSLADNNPDLAKEWNTRMNYPLTTKDITAGSKQKVGWICSKCGHEWQATINNRNKGTGCPRCRNRKKSNNLQ